MGSFLSGMAKRQLYYVELKSGYSDNGPAWICLLRVSQSGRSVYFNGQLLKKSGGRGISGNFYDLETGDGYWVSGVKKNGLDRHWAGRGETFIESSAVGEYLKICSMNALPRNCVEIADLLVPDIDKMSRLENKRLDR